MWSRRGRTDGGHCNPNSLEIRVHHKLDGKRPRSLLNSRGLGATGDDTQCVGCCRFLVRPSSSLSSLRIHFSLKLDQFLCGCFSYGSNQGEPSCVLSALFSLFNEKITVSGNSTQLINQMVSDHVHWLMTFSF